MIVFLKKKETFKSLSLNFSSWKWYVAAHVYYWMLPSMLHMTWTMHILCMFKFSDYFISKIWDDYHSTKNVLKTCPFIFILILHSVKWHKLLLKHCKNIPMTPFKKHYCIQSCSLYPTTNFEFRFYQFSQGWPRGLVG